MPAKQGAKFFHEYKNVPDYSFKDFDLLWPGVKTDNLLDKHIEKIIDTYQHRKEEPRYSRRVSMVEIEKNDYNLNISRYVSTAKPEQEIDLHLVHADIETAQQAIHKTTTKHNAFLEELGLPPLR